ncbi:MAG: box helicase [Mycobacterium sp.]|jgi:superfamily II RNA helicase|nr:box helicase [Mycobacterium sp.]
MTAPTADPAAAAAPPARTLAARVEALPPERRDPDTLYELFVDWVSEQGVELYPAQDEAVIELMSGNNVVLTTPTGSGKSLVAVAAHAAALAEHRRSYYTAPIKALVSEKFFALCRIFGADRVGMLTGDASVNPTAPIICCTAEILANLALRGTTEIGQVVMDEFHFYAEPDRGWAWQVPLLVLPETQFLLMSATLGDTSRFEAELAERTGRPTAVVASAVRPVPLTFDYVLTPLHETLERLLGTQQAPVYVVHFTQAAAVERAQALMSINVCTREEKDAIAALIGGFRFTTGFGKVLSRLVRHGIGVHHAGMLPKYRRLVELLAQSGLLKVICGTDTLGVGINVPIRTVLFTGLTKFDGQKVRLLRAREFHQIAGRAGRAGFDTAGLVVVQAPEHVIENEKALAKAGDDPKKRRKVVRRTPPAGQIGWGEPTFERLVASEPETLTSSFTITAGMLLAIVARPGDAFQFVADLVTGSHEPRARQLAHLRRAIAIYRSLLAAGVVERLETPDAQGRTVRLTVDLPPDFALDQPLSAFALAAFELLDPESPEHTLDVLSVLEATLDNPRAVLFAQRDKARGEAVAEFKAQGMEYEERRELVEEVSWPQPLAELLTGAFDIYRRAHPEVADHELAPKSIARDLSERSMTFVEYVSFYSLSRSEGLLLRYLADAFKALRRTVPEEVRSEDVEELTEWLGELVRQVDSSLLDEWEALTHPETAPVRDERTAEEKPPPVTANRRAFRVLVRNALFRRVELAARRRWAELGELDDRTGPDAWSAEAWATALDPYWEDHDEIGTGPDARGPSLLIVEEFPDRWEVRQIIADPAGDHDWGISAVVDLPASDEAGYAVLRVTRVDRL